MANLHENGVWLLQTDTIAPFPYLYKSLDLIREELKKEYNEDGFVCVSFEEEPHNECQTTFIIRFKITLIEEKIRLAIYNAFFCEVKG